MNISPEISRKQLRKQLRVARRSLSPAQQKRAGKELARWLKNYLPVLRSQHIAYYLPNDGEIDPRPLASALEKMGKRCYLPRLHADGTNRVWFVRYRSGDPLYKNRYGIPEPHIRNPHLPAWALQVVLMPLVGFDRSGNRLGMGGGFYDRSFAFKQQRGTCKPLLLGLAHSIQEVPALPCESWDVPLDGIVTERALLRLVKYG